MLARLREQSLAFWNKQSISQRLILIVLVVSAAILIPLFINWANTPSYSVAYSGLSEADAGQIVQTLADQGITYKVQPGGTILVPSNKVYEIRLRMANEGLPKSGSVGFEVFSGNTLGMTDFTQRVNYQRALEGELERTIGNLASIQAVRVHIVTPEKSLISEDQAPTTASITIQEKSGARLDVTQVNAITHLVASSVEGLKPENVVVVDVNGNLLATGISSPESSQAAQMDTHHQVELNASGELRRKIQNLLDSSLGPNKSVVQANVLMDWTERSTTTQAYDPTKSTVRSSQIVSEVYTTTGVLNGGVPGASTNLPSTTINDNSNSNQASNYSKNERTVNYEITQSEIKEVRPPGEVKQISLSVLVDGITNTVQLGALQTAIGAAAGISKDRGDTLSVQSLAFDHTFYANQAADLTASQKNNLYWQIGQGVMAALILIAVLWYVQRLLSNLRLASAQAWTPVMRPVTDAALPDTLAGMMPPGLSPPPSPISIPSAPPMPIPITLPEPKLEIPALSAADEQMQQIIARLAEENPANVAEIIQMWLNEDEK